MKNAQNSPWGALDQLSETLSQGEAQMRKLTSLAAQEGLHAGFNIGLADVPSRPAPTPRGYFHGAGKVLAALIRAKGAVTAEGKAAADKAAAIWLALKRAGTAVADLPSLPGITWQHVTGLAKRGGGPRPLKEGLDVSQLEVELTEALELVAEDANTEAEIYFALGGWAGFTPKCVIPPPLVVDGKTLTPADFRLITMAGTSQDGKGKGFKLRTTISIPSKLVDGRSTLEQVLEEHDEGMLALVPVGQWMETFGPKMAQVFPKNRAQFLDMELSDGGAVSAEFLAAACTAWNPMPRQQHYRRRGDQLVADPKGRVIKSVQPSPRQLQDTVRQLPTATAADLSIRAAWVGQLDMEVRQQELSARPPMNWLNSYTARTRGFVRRDISESVDAFVYEAPAALRSGALAPVLESGTLENASYQLSRGIWPEMESFAFKSYSPSIGEMDDELYAATARPVTGVSSTMASRAGGMDEEERAISRVQAVARPSVSRNSALNAALAALRGEPEAEVEAEVESEAAMEVEAEDFTVAEEVGLDELMPEAASAEVDEAHPLEGDQFLDESAEAEVSEEFAGAVAGMTLDEAGDEEEEKLA